MKRFLLVLWGFLWPPLVWFAVAALLFFGLILRASARPHETHIVYPGQIDSLVTVQVQMNGRMSTLVVVNGLLPETIVEEMTAGQVPVRRFTFSAKSLAFNGKLVPEYVCPAAVITQTQTINVYRAKVKR